LLHIKPVLFIFTIQLEHNRCIMENIFLVLILFFSLGREWRCWLLDLADIVIDALEPPV